MSLQLSMNFKKHIWSCPAEYKDLSHAKEIAIESLNIAADICIYTNHNIVSETIEI